MARYTNRFTDLSSGRRDLLLRMLKKEGRDPSGFPILPRSGNRGEIPLSYAQQSMWFLAKLTPDAPYYNLPSVVRLRGPLHREALGLAFSEITRRHEALRTTFTNVDGKPVQRIEAAKALPVPWVDLSHLRQGEREKEALQLASGESLRPFDLAAGPLVRVTLYALAPDDHLLLVNLHHIVWDGWSIGVLNGELSALYEAFSSGRPSPLPELPVQYADYALWQREWLSGEVLERMTAYWRTKLLPLPRLDLPLDFPRPAVQTHRGMTQPLALPDPLAKNLEALSAENGATLFMTLLSAFKVMLTRYAGQSRIVVGTPTANRKQGQTHGLIGYFANILALHSDLAGDPTFLTVLQRVKETTLEAHAHQEMPFDMLVEKLKVERDPSRNPVFQVMFALHRESLDAMAMPGLAIEPVQLPGETTHFDLGLHLWHRQGRIYGYFSYNRDLFKPETIGRMVSHFWTLLTGIAKDPAAQISALPLLCPEETGWLRKWSALPEARPLAATLHELIDARVAGEGQAIAVASVASQAPYATLDALSYRELAERSDALAHHLFEARFSSESGPETDRSENGANLPAAATGSRSATASQANLSSGRCLSAGARLETGTAKCPGAPSEAALSPETAMERGPCIGLLMPPCPQAVVAVLGILKSGGTVLPLDPDLPEERLAALLADANVSRILTLERFRESLSLHQVPLFFLDGKPPAQARLEGGTCGRVSSSRAAWAFAAADYTVQVSHGRTCRQLEQLQALSASGAGQPALLCASPGQEAFIREMLRPLVSGGPLIIPETKVPFESADFAALIEARRIPVIHLTPDSLTRLVSTGAHSASPRSGPLKEVLCSGGYLPQTTIDAFFRNFQCELTYLYAPPEAAGHTGWQKCRPVKNKETALLLTPGSLPACILDDAGHPAPVGVPGEIWVDAAGLSVSSSNPSTLTVDPFATAKSPVSPPATESIHPVDSPASNRSQVSGDGRALRHSTFSDDPDTSGRESNLHVAPVPWDSVSAPSSDAQGTRFIRTFDRGRFLSDGSLELFAPSGGRIWKNGRRFKTWGIEAALLAHPEVCDCHVRWHSGTLSSGLVAYLATTGPASGQALEKFLHGRLPEDEIPEAFVRLNHLPLNADGDMDTDALDRLPAVDGDLARRCEAELAKIPQIDRVKVLIGETPRATSLIHIADLIPEYLENRRMSGPLPDTGEPAATHVTEVTEEAPQGLAYACGGPLAISDSAPRTLTEALIRTAQTCPEHGLTLIQKPGSRTFLSYPELLAQARKILSGLQAEGLCPGDRVVLQLETLRDHFCSFWACVLGGIVPVTVAIPPDFERKNSVLAKLWHTWQLLDHPPILTSGSLAEPLAAFPGLFQQDAGARARILTVSHLRKSGVKTSIYNAKPSDTLFFQLTSGSTGAPKCIQETHDGVIHHICGSRLFNDYTSQDVTLNWLPMDHVVPILTCHLKDTCLGIRQIHVHPSVILAEPLEWLDLMEKERVTHSWAPNFGFKLITDRLTATPGKRWDLSAVRFLMNAGEQVTLPVVSAFLKLLAPSGIRQATMQPAFGMAEVCTCMTYRNDFTIETGARRIAKCSLSGVLTDAKEGQAAISFIDLGPPMPGVEIRIAGDDHQTLPERVIGRFQIRGNVTTPGYLNNASANAEAFVGEAWFNSGDLGFIRNGRLFLTGREKETLVIHGANLYCYEIEEIVNGVSGVLPTFCAACAVEDPSSGTEGLAVFFVPRSEENPAGADLLQAIRSQVARELGISPLYVIPLEKERFPKTTSGKIQRSALKKDLAAGKFDSRIKQIELLLETPDTMPDWFFHKTWRPANPTLRPLAAIFDLLIFDDRSGLGMHIARVLGQERVIRADYGPGFIRHDRRHFTLNPAHAKDYDRLLDHLSEEGTAVSTVVHLWGWDPGGRKPVADTVSMADRSLHSLLEFPQALARSNPSRRPIPFLMVTRGVHHLNKNDTIDPQTAPLPGLIRTMAKEMPWLNCRHLDLPGCDPAVGAAIVIDELRALSKHREVAYRDGRRLVSLFEKILPKKRTELPFKVGEVILISGGLGGIGLSLAAYLLTNHKARLILMGRTPLGRKELPQETENATTADGPAGGDSVAGATPPGLRLRLLRQLERLGGEVIYAACDVSCADGVKEVVQNAQKRWNRPVAGAIHLAGVFPARLLEAETRESLEEVLCAKVEGARVLSEAVADNGWFISFGSLYGNLGGVAAGAYAAANQALETFARNRADRLGNTWHVSWSNWDETGMSEGYLLKEQSRAQGYHMIAPQKGILCLLAALQSGYHALVAGLDDTRAPVRPHVIAAPLPLDGLSAFYTAQEGADPDPAALALTDRFGTSARPLFTRLPKMPLDKRGEIEISRLKAGHGQSRPRTRQIAPRTGMEQTIAAIWKEVLALDEVGIHESFFELGGQSILLAQVQIKLSAALNREIPVVELFRYPTIGALSRYLATAEKEKPSFEKVMDRARKQKMSRKKKGRPARKLRAQNIRKR